MVSNSEGEPLFFGILEDNHRRTNPYSTIISLSAQISMLFCNMWRHWTHKRKVSKRVCHHSSPASRFRNFRLEVEDLTNAYDSYGLLHVRYLKRDCVSKTNILLTKSCLLAVRNHPRISPTCVQSATMSNAEANIFFWQCRIDVVTTKSR